MPPIYPRLQPKPDIFPRELLFAISGRKAAIRFSPVPKKKLARITRKIASHKSPGPTKESSKVKNIQPIEVKNSRRFLAAQASAYIPIIGAVIIMRIYETASVAVQANVPQS